MVRTCVKEKEEKAEKVIERKILGKISNFPLVDFARKWNENGVMKIIFLWLVLKEKGKKMIKQLV